MRHTRFFHAALIMLLGNFLLCGCKKNAEDPGPGPGPGPNPNGIEVKLLFLTSTTRQGNIPGGPANNGLLKTSIQDTLRLTDEILKPIKFLHKDTTKNVSGAYIQVTVNGKASSDYYDVPELKDTEESDTVSIIPIGVDPTDLPKPLSGDIKIVPYDKNKQPITQIIKPLKIEEKKVDDPAGSCGLSSQAGKVWRWDASFIQGKDKFAFYSDPFMVHGAGGQDIEGSCCNGNSKWPLFCQGEVKHNRKLHFATYYQIKFETFQFFPGSFRRQTMEDSPVPLPDQSDFCSGGSGRVRESLKHTVYDGTWQIIPFAPPPGFLFKDSLQLELRYTSSTGTGYGNPGGVLHQLDCKVGSLVLLQINRERPGEFLVKIYTLVSIDGEQWYQ